MPVGAQGTTLTLTAQFQDGTGSAVAPVTPLVSILNPLGATIIGPVIPEYAESLGRYNYDFAIPVDALIGSWTAVWSGLINEAAVEATEVFTVIEAGQIVFGPDCDTPIWASVEQFLALHSEVDDDDALDALIEATWLLSGLVNDRFHYAECWTDHYQYRNGLCKIELAHQPVDTVFDVTRFDPDTGEETAIDGWKKMAGGAVRICCGTSLWFRDNFGGTYPCGSNCDDTVIAVRYRTKDNLPPGVDRQVLKLAWEFWKSGQGKSCALPERVTNVTREGVSWVVLDPLDFLDKGLTGIGSVDQWISRVNMRGWAGLIDPLTRPRLMLSELTGCGESCTGTEA